jgi:L-threonylcarbamoyladenylate synthase
MKTNNIYTANKNNFAKAKKILETWWVVAFSTETVYGLWANALDEKAVAKIFALKNRPQDNPIISHVARKEQIEEYAYITNEIERTIIDKLMPWPITILLPPKASIPLCITAWHPLMSIRIPSHPVALAVLSLCDFPIAAPSANISTRPSPTSAQMVYDNFWEDIPMIIDGGDCLVGIESTVVKVENNKITITRPWFVTKEDLELLFDNKIEVIYGTKPSAETPWNRYKHYAPDANMSIFWSIDNLLSQIAAKKQQKIGIIATKEFLEKNKKEITWLDIQVFELWSEENMLSCAHNLFSIYHQCDKQWLEEVFIQSLPEHGIGYAIMNRIHKSITKK